jgi:hypothetical protein
MLRRVLCLVAASILLGAAGARAELIQLSDRTRLTGPVLDWSAYGAPGQIVSTPVDQRFGAVTASVGSSAGIVEVRQQGLDFAGNFAAGDALLSLPDGYKSDAFGVSFSGQAVYGLGVQIEPASGFLGGFTGGMDLYGAGNRLLGVVLADGRATQAGDGSAVFLGAASDAAIAYVRFFVDENDPFFPIEGDLAINAMSLSETALVPEPGSLSLLVAAFGMVILVNARASKMVGCAARPTLRGVYRGIHRADSGCGAGGE